MIEQPRFPEALIALGNHLKLCPTLPAIANLSWRYYDRAKPGFVEGLDIQLYGAQSALAAWAETLTLVSSYVERLRSGAVHGAVRGLVGDVPVCVWTSVDGTGFPDSAGVHEWDVTALLQEAR